MFNEQCFTEQDIESRQWTYMRFLVSQDTSEQPFYYYMFNHRGEMVGWRACGLDEEISCLELDE